jgi:uncharacterized low-complexity protein
MRTRVAYRVLVNLANETLVQYQIQNPTVIEEETFMKSTKQTALTLALGSAIAASLSVAPVSAAENPFAAQSMDKGYMVAEADKAAEGKCGGKKAAEAKCGAKAKEGACGGAKAKGDAKKAEDGKTTAEKAKDGKCGEGKCGGTKR